MSDTKNRRTAQRLFAEHGGTRERKAIIADLRAEAESYGGIIREVILACAMRIERGLK